MCSKWHDEQDLRIIEMEHTCVMLNRDQFFPGYTFVFARDHVTELFHLSSEIRNVLMAEVSSVAAALYEVFQPAKINYELLGNMVPHMHWHIVPRFTSDPLWPRPIWSEPHQELILKGNEYAERIKLVREKLLSRDLQAEVI